MSMKWNNAGLWRCLMVMGCLITGAIMLTEPAYADSVSKLCVSTLRGDVSKAGDNGIIGQVFKTINDVMGEIAKKFYEGIANNAQFKQVVSAIMALYVAIYGAMIMFNLAHYHVSEVIQRLLRIAILYAIITGGWTFFDEWVGKPVIDSMNHLIMTFTEQATSILSGAGVPSNDLPTAEEAEVTSSGGKVALKSSAMKMLFVPVSMMFGEKFMIAIVALLAYGSYGWLLSLFLLWGVVEFIFMLIGAVFTYIKSLVGLFFLFGIAPIFFACLLFEKTREIFKGWIN